MCELYDRYVIHHAMAFDLNSLSSGEGPIRRRKHSKKLNTESHS